MQHLFTALAIPTVVVGMALAGCSASSDDRALQVPGRDLNHAETMRISDAEQRLIKGCMNRQGFSYWEWDPLSLEESRPVRYVQDDVSWAHEHGYGSRIQAKDLWARGHNPNGVYRSTLTGERRSTYDRVLDGGPDSPLLTAKIPGGGTISRRAGGCVSQAQKQLYGDLPTWFHADKVATNLSGLYVPQVMRDQQFQDGLRRWSACMQQAGHPYPDPGQAREATDKATQGQSGAALDKAFRTEIKIAVADATCARRVSLRALARAREAHYIQQLAGEYADELATRHRLQRAALARAEKIVGPRAQTTPTPAQQP